MARSRLFLRFCLHPSGSLNDHYLIRKGDVSRVAGLDSQLIVLEPKDALRYGHHLWAEVNSGLILKARIVDERSETIEQFALNQLTDQRPHRPGNAETKVQQGRQGVADTQCASLAKLVCRKRLDVQDAITWIQEECRHASGQAIRKMALKRPISSLPMA
ncbi:MAG: hypothetical protein M5R42_11940 [Rhodocyclaceae bacterium]|nr:hypothetical protein [Rhodocyclaceae bacterium]